LPSAVRGVGAVDASTAVRSLGSSGKPFEVPTLFGTGMTT
jgi:hypothetical protein